MASAPDDHWNYRETERGGVVVFDGREHGTHYPRHIVEMLAARKGIRRTVDYLSFADERGRVLEPLLNYVAARSNQVSILEPGCSSGHIAEALLRSSAVSRLVSFDVDPAMVEICRAKKDAFGLTRWEVAEAETPGFVDETFDVVLLFAVMEHVDRRYRRALVDGCYDRLKPGGLLVVLDSPNRLWPLEYHTLRLPVPYIQYLPPRAIFRIARILGRFASDEEYADFIHPNAGWWGTTLAELKPSRGTAVEVSEQIGYGVPYRLRLLKERGTKGRVAALLFRAFTALLRPFGTPPSAVMPSLYVAFRKT